MFEKLSEKVQEMVCMNPSMHLDSNRELLIENCRRIEEYNEVFMRLISGDLCIQIWGSNLKAYDFKTKGLIVRGKITQIEFIERKSKSNAQSTKGLC